MTEQKLSGVWYNQLGSKVDFHVHDSGHISGKYDSADEKAEHHYDLEGRLDLDPPSGQGVSIGWAVSWRNDKSNAHSTTTWSGQFMDSSGEPRILTHWLLTSSTTPDKLWSSTNIGDDTFTRTKPSAEEIEQARALSVGSPLPEDMLATLKSDR